MSNLCKVVLTMCNVFVINEQNAKVMMFSPEDLIFGGDFCVLALLTAQGCALRRRDKCEKDLDISDVLHTKCSYCCSIY